MISIDGGHTADITAHDLATAEGALAEGGIVLLDDCFKEMWPGVINGVHRYFSEPRSIIPFGIGANKTFFCHRPFAAGYAAEENGQKSCRAGVFREPGGLLQPFALDPWQVVP